MDARPLRVLLADDHPLIRDTLRRDLEAGGLEVCAEARLLWPVVHALRPAT
jgi:DNA-binding NarL/FixJ family response regulator